MYHYSVILNETEHHECMLLFMCPIMSSGRGIYTCLYFSMLFNPTVWAGDYFLNIFSIMIWIPLYEQGIIQFLAWWYEFEWVQIFFHDNIALKPLLWLINSLLAVAEEISLHVLLFCDRHIIDGVYEMSMSLTYFSRSFRLIF